MLRVFLAVVALALLLNSTVRAQVVRSYYVESVTRTPYGAQSLMGHPLYDFKTIEVALPRLKIKQTGILTSRLSDKERKRWHIIEQLIFATGADAKPLHPFLHELWRWADESGHIIYLELPNDKTTQSSTAGSFNIEQFDPTGRRHVAVLKLFLSNIDLAVSSPEVARTSGFIPFAELRKEERYAEVLGHELAHVQFVLQNSLRTHLVHELIETTNDILLSQTRQKDGVLALPEMRHRLTQRDELLRALERQAETVEEAIWQELTASKKIRAELLASHRRR